MMNEHLNSLYHEVIIDHGKHPRNFGALKNAQSLQGINPLCGDSLTLYLQVEKGIIVDVKFSGQGCAISMASASLMTQAVKGKSLNEAKHLFLDFHNLILQEAAPETVADHLGKLMILQGVKAYPSRVKCATLAWHTLNGMLSGDTTAVSTEGES